MPEHGGERTARRIECTTCYFAEEFDHGPCGVEWCICPCNSRGAHDTGSSKADL